MGFIPERLMTMTLYMVLLVYNYTMAIIYLPAPSQLSFILVRNAPTVNKCWGLGWGFGMSLPVAVVCVQHVSTHRMRTKCTLVRRTLTRSAPRWPMCQLTCLSSRRACQGAAAGLGFLHSPMSASLQVLLQFRGFRVSAFSYVSIPPGPPAVT